MNYKNKLVLYNNIPYKITKSWNDLVNLSHPNGGKILFKNIPITDLFVYGGTKLRKLKEYRSLK